MFLQSIKHQWYDFRYGVKNLIKWFRVIWADRSWDHVFIYKILEHKLRLQSDSMRSGILLHKDRYANQMAEVAELANKLADTWTHYELPAIEEFDAIWGETKIDFEPVEGSNSQYFTMVTRKVDGTNLTEEDDKKMRAARSVMYKEIKRQTDADKRKLFTKIANNIDHWWW